MIGDYNGTIQVYDSNRTLIRNFTAHSNSNESNCIENLMFFPGKSLVASVADDAWVKIWNTSDWSLVTAYNGHKSHIYGVECVDDDTIATGSLGIGFKV